MLVLVVAMLVCLGLAVTIVALVALPARREGREVFTPEGADLVARVRDRAEDVTTSALDKAQGLLPQRTPDRAPERPQTP
ncbi:MAG: hypothetical protein U0Q14_07675 [Dermatophilaceae bacterium]|jgi:hypothetical protein|nr:hypothetical protein [Candidatus Lutibacillus vidarii]HON74984.1 hypothetical protein [Dermatophilaceae bacterium]